MKSSGKDQLTTTHRQIRSMCDDIHAMDGKLPAKGVDVRGESQDERRASPNAGAAGRHRGNGVRVRHTVTITLDACWQCC
jgi:hypothetical protein